MWDSMKILSDKTSVRYAGPNLESGRLYFWRVRWWDHNGDMAESLETGHFMTGMMDPTSWTNIHWIAAPPGIKAAPLFNKSVPIDTRTVSSAALFVSGLGFCKPFVNGVDLNAQFDPPIALTPGWSNYERRVPYTVYDVTDEITKSLSNFVDVNIMLGVGWRNSTVYVLKDSIPNNDNVPRVLRLKLAVTFTNGSTADVLISDASWDVTNSSIVSDSIYNGETYIPSTTEMYEKSVVVSGPQGQMYLPEIPPIVEAGIEKPIRIYSRENGEGKIISQVVDFGNNSAGYCYINVEHAENVTIHHAEVPLHPPYGEADGSLYYDNLKGAAQLDTVLTNLSMDYYKPTFTYHGFRYVEVTGYKGKLQSDDIKKIVIHSNVAQNGYVTTSSKILNAIQSCAVRSQLSNMMSVPTDCDQRTERLGWMGDAGLSAESMMMNFETRAFHTNFLTLIGDEFDNGTLPDVVPFYKGGSRPADPAWGDAFLEILRLLSTVYHDTDILSTYYDYAAQYIQTLKGTIPPEGVGNLYSHYGDWVPPPEQPKVNGSFVSAFSLLMGLQRLKFFAETLGKSVDITLYEQLFEELFNDFNKAFINANGSYLNEIQATYVLPLALHMWNSKEKFAKNFTKSFMRKDKVHITSGIVGTKYIFDALKYSLQQSKLSLELAEQVDYPSWGYMIYNPYEPATGMWELWNSHNGSAKMDSRNHHMFSSISAYIKSQAGGLIQPKGSSGFDKIHFYPASVLGLRYANVSYQFPKPVSISWQRSGGIQCAKSPEDQSPKNPTLPKHGGLVLSCGGEDGGVITVVTFASFGNPSGQCGGYYKVNSCHAPNSMQVVGHLCLGKRTCNVPTGVDFWGDPCPGATKWLSVQVQCQSEGSSKPDYKYSSITADVSVPIGSTASLYMPAYGKRDFTVWENDKVVFDSNHKLSRVAGIIGSHWDSTKDSLVLELESGDYSFIARGKAPNVYCVDSSIESANGSVILHCEKNSSEAITSIDWVSYGNPVAKQGCFSHTIGDCHVSGIDTVVASKCLGKPYCEVALSEKILGKADCLKEKARFIVEFACSVQ